MKLALALGVLLMLCISLSWGHRGPPKSEKRLAGKHKSHGRQRPGHAHLEDPRAQLMEGATGPKEAKCPCHISLRKRRHSKLSRNKRMSRKCRKQCMKEWKTRGCQREPCRMDVAMPLS